ncbi:MAG: nicotinate phosphoribosyltransferase [Chloroflexia bacterium]
MKSKARAIAEGILYTDQYQLTMAQVYFRAGLHRRRVQFDHFFRSYPDYGTHQAGYCVNAGLESLLDWMEEARFGEAEVAYLRGQKGRSGRSVFDGDFLDWLRREGDFSGITLHAIPEGRVVHPHEPLTIVEGPMAMAQVLETSLLNHLNFQTLIATKAARIHDTVGGRMVLEFGLRRAQDRGGNAGTRAALIGGADFSSNVGMSHVLGYAPKGTHAHSMVQVFMALGEGELGAFRAYAEAYPDDCLLLVDTINTLESGVPNAIKVFEELRAKRHDPVGIRLDSGDLAYLSIQSARMLDAAGFPNTSITLSNDLDEMVIWRIMARIAAEAPRYGVDADALSKRLVFGVGTRLITSQGDPALGGVYKLVAVEDGGEWKPAMKVSDQAAKTPNPGRKAAWRLYDSQGKASADLLALHDENPASMERVATHHPSDHTQMRVFDKASLSEVESLLVEVLRDGRLVYELPDIEAMRRRRIADVERLEPGVRQLISPHVYHVSLTQKLWELKQELIRSTLGE